MFVSGDWFTGWLLHFFIQGFIEFINKIFAFCLNFLKHLWIENFLCLKNKFKLKFCHIYTIPFYLKRVELLLLLQWLTNSRFLFFVFQYWHSQRWIFRNKVRDSRCILLWKISSQCEILTSLDGRDVQKIH